MQVDNVRNNDDKSNHNKLNTKMLNSNGLNEDNNNIESNNAVGSYDDFVNYIGNLSPGSIIELDKDYNFSSKNYKPLVLDVDDLIINGNNHTIYGNSHDPRIFNITADGVLINDLCFRNLDFTFENTASYVNKGNYIIAYNSAYSPITVNGDYVEITACKFIGTSAVNGGAIFWNGDMGKIDSCIFLNSTAKALGSAVFMSGSHNKIIDSKYFNCISEMGQDAVYFGNDRKRISIKNCLLDDSSKMFDGNVVDLDPEIFHYSYISHVADKEIDVTRLLYSSMVNGGIQYLDNDTFYYCEHFDLSGDIIFSLFRNFTDNRILYSKAYHFSNLHNIADVFPLLLNNSFSLDVDITKTVYVYDVNSYKAAIKTTYKSLDSIKEYAEADGLDNIKNKVLNIIFTKEMTIDCRDTINPSSLGFDSVNLAGNGSTIKTVSKDRDENTWLKLDKDIVFSASNLTVTGFNTAVESLNGTCIFSHINFIDNHKDYVIDRDWGAAILNLGIALCYNCLFKNNKAHHGGAIFNQGYMNLENCSFVNNHAEKYGDDICVSDGGELTTVSESGNLSPENYIAATGLNSIAPAKGGDIKIDIVESISDADITLREVVCVAGSFVAGFLVGVFTANPVLGAIVGGSIGAIAGTTATAYVFTHNYDYRFDRLKPALILIGGSIAVGIIGGIAGGLLGSSIKACIKPVTEPYVPADFESFHSSVSDAGSVVDIVLK